MSSSCTPILVGASPPVSEILLLSKMPKFPFRPMDYSPWSSKNLIASNSLKKIMQVGIDGTCIYTNFGGCGVSSFEDIATFQFRQLSSIIIISYYFLLQFTAQSIICTGKGVKSVLIIIVTFTNLVMYQNSKFPLMH